MGWAKNDEEYLSIFLAMANQRENFVMGMNMPDEVYDYKVPIFIRQDKSDNLVTNLRNADDKHPCQYAWVDGNGEYILVSSMDGTVTLLRINQL
jgi:hypothetical protein